MNEPPFAQEDELYPKLYISQSPLSIHRRPVATTSKPETAIDGLPGQPRIGLHDIELASYLQAELITADLNKLAPHLWLVAKQDSAHISSLTHQIVRGRQIIITENPGLHLVWIYDRVYIKPIPKYLLSHAFWGFYLCGVDSPIRPDARQQLVQAALGFLRSYFYLVQHKSDFSIATNDDHRLIPKSISYSEFVSFIKAFDGKRIGDDIVSPRYAFGELRLSRLNLCSKVFLRRISYHKIHGQYGEHLAQFYGPILFIFGIFSVLLSAMQVALAVQAMGTSSRSWLTFAQVSRWFSVFTIICSAILALVPVVSLLVLLTRETVFALTKLYEKRTALKAAGEKRHGKSVV
ncbi:predicted protein [Uncinocarpus reesii 1704]|uniref:Subtilisin-like serine protease protein n=1 Tax=Uncinocarpus reesii (strain UAMH 1704) TaxID=336963 RepID=C4JDB8_UNCRE|nr:uncharacterized protein UREG_00354 [Uncinocarpus reesii 1704]EEP75508.1 predicted protein [Uncinocarpus reesii 1704]